MSRLIDEHFLRELLLDDGTPVRLRLLRPDDRDKLAEGMRALSAMSRYRRFMSATGELSAEALRYLTEVDQENHVAIVAGTADAEERGLGIARYVRDERDPTSAEAAVTVVDAWQGRGLGRLLLAALTVAARERGIARFHAEILASNSPMLALLRHLGAQLAAPQGEEVLVDLPLPELPSDGDPTHASGPGAPLLRFFGDELAKVRG